MANAMAVLMIETEPPIMMQCAEATTIAKGQCLKVSDAFTVAATAAANDLFGGIAAEEKVGGDGKTTVAVFRRGYFKVEAGTTGVSVGLPVIIEANNEFKDTAANGSDTGYVWGKALETAADGETFLIDLGAG
jgi:hypothetical protein